MSINETLFTVFKVKIKLDTRYDWHKVLYLNNELPELGTGNWNWRF